MFMQLFVIALSIWALQYWWKRRGIYKLYNEIPKISLNWYPVIGHAHLFGSTNKDRMDFFIYLANKAVEFGGLTTFWLANKLYISVCDPDIAEGVLKTCLDKDDSTMRYMRGFSGNGTIFAPENSMGIEINSQTNRYHDFLQAFDELTRLVALRMLSPWLYWDTIYELLPQAKVFAYWRKKAYDFIDSQIRFKRKELAALESTQESVKNKTFLDMIIESSGKENGFTDVELREEIAVILGAGSDTSAVATCYTAVILSRYPDIQEKVYQELEDVFQKDSDRPVTAADLPKLVYLEAVVKETLRLYPPVPVFVREIFEDVKLPNGMTLVKGVAFLVNVYGMHRNHKYWGEDVETFRPERFLEGPLRHPVQFIPFSYSKRNCVGGTYALMSIKTALATMLRQYRVLPPAGLDPQKIKEPLEVGFDIMMRHLDNYAVRLEYRNK